MNGLSRLWRRLKLLYAFLLPIRFSILALALAAFAFIGADQGRDMIRRLGECRPVTGKPHWGEIAGFIALLNILALQVWFWARQMLRLEPPPPHDDDRLFGRTPDPEEFRRLVIALPRILGALVYVAVFYAFFRVRCTYGENVQTVNHLILILIAISFALFLVFVVLRRRWLEKRDDHQVGHMRPGDLAPGAKFLLILSLALELAFFIHSTLAPTNYMGFGAGAMVLLVLSLWVPFGSVLVYLGIRARAPILTFLLVLAVLVSPLADHNHVVRTVTTPQALIDARPTVDEKVAEWYARVAPSYPPGAPVPAFIVATEGGGIRAAYWTAAVLDSLHDTAPLFRRNLFAVSSVSGGSLGALVSTALLSEPRLTSGFHRSGSTMLGHDFLTPTLAAMAQSDLVQRFLPFGFPDRERALEEAWERGYAKAIDAQTFSRGMLELYAKNPALPSLFINGTMVETGDRIVTSNCRLRPRDAAANSPLLAFRNAFDGFALLGSDLPLSAAAGMSARFTYVSPAGRVPKGNGMLGHVVDGGYFENSGAVTAVEIALAMRAIAAKNQWNLVPVIVLIDFENCSPNHLECGDEPDLSKLKGDCSFDGYAPFPYRGTEGPPEPSAPYLWANEVMSPLNALLNTRGARGEQAVGDARSLGRPINGRPTVIEFRLVQRDVPIPLGWVLSHQAQHAIDSAVETKGNRWARDTIAQWLEGPRAATDAMAVESARALETVR